METVTHPRIRPGILEDRLYQSRIVETALAHNTLAVLPTGLGKTAIALRVMAEFLLREPTRSILFLAPTRPLVVQHGRTIAATLFSPPPVILTGTIPPERRATLLQPPQIVVATPQVIENDLEQGGFSLANFSLIVFDEAHRAVGDYPYVAIGRTNRDGPRARVLAMTASPGSRIERIREVWTHLGIERFEYRTATDADVLPYVHGIQIETVEVPLPAEVRHLAILLRTAFQRQVEVLRRYSLLSAGDAGRRDLLALGERLHREVAATRKQGGLAPPGLWAAVTAQAAAMKTLYALELIESQGVESLREFLTRQTRSASGRMTPAQRTFLNDPDVVQLRAGLNSISIEHPKVAKTLEIVRAELNRSELARVIVFSQYRDTVELLVRALENLHDPAIRPARFVGQAARGSEEGLSQKEQVRILDQFREGTVNCLVSTSVAEEGLDIPSTDVVVFYEPIPDVIRTIQRRGRTGRARAGRAIVLVSQGTRDVGMHRGAGARERRMHEMLERVEMEARDGALRPPTSAPVVQRTLTEYGQ
ncbi:MAG: helicase-related protein [Thermoplasmata archaeon]